MTSNNGADVGGERSSILFFGAPASLAGELTHLFAGQADLVHAGFDDLSFDLRPRLADIREDNSSRKLDSFSLVAFATPQRGAHLLGAIVAHLEHHSVPFLGKWISRICVSTKLFQYTRFAHCGLPFPRSIYLPNRRLRASYEWLSQELGLPFILKPINLSRGRHNYLVADKPTFARLTTGPETDMVKFIAQEYIRNEELADLRVLIFGGDVVLVIKRTSQNGSHITNTSAGGIGTLINRSTIDPEVLTLALTAASTTGNDVTGVDLIQDSGSGRWFILEANSAPAISSGVFADLKVAAYASFLRRELSHNPRRKFGRSPSAMETRWI